MRREAFAAVAAQLRAAEQQSAEKDVKVLEADFRSVCLKQRLAETRDSMPKEPNQLVLHSTWLFLVRHV